MWLPYANLFIKSELLLKTDRRQTTDHATKKCHF